MRPGRRSFQAATVRRQTACCIAALAGGGLLAVGVCGLLTERRSPVPLTWSGVTIHLVFGFAGGLAAWRGAQWSARYLITTGLVIAAVWTYQMAQNPITTGLSWSRPEAWYYATTGGSLLLAGIVAYLLGVDEDP